MDITDVWRMLNAMLAAVAFVLVMVDLRQHFVNLPRRVQRIAMGTVGLLFATVVGSIEQVLQHVPIGWRLPIVTSALLWIISAFFLSDDDRP